MEMKKNPKNPKKYVCIICDFHTSNKKDFERHGLTAKHKKNTIGNVGNKMEMCKNPAFVCECNKIFCTNAGLWKHKNKCCTNGDVKNVEMHVELENEEGEQFGIERMIKNVQSFSSLKMEDMNNILFSKLDEWKGELPYGDDTAILSCKFF